MAPTKWFVNKIIITQEKLPRNLIIYANIQCTYVLKDPHKFIFRRFSQVYVDLECHFEWTFLKNWFPWTVRSRPPKNGDVLAVLEMQILYFCPEAPSLNPRSLLPNYEGRRRPEEPWQGVRFNKWFYMPLPCDSMTVEK